MSKDKAADKKKSKDSSEGIELANEEAKAKAIAKMKQAQAEGSDELLQENSGDSSTELKVKESDIDPKAKKALKDLLGEKVDENANLSKVKVYSPFRIYYDSPANSVSAVNNTGPFDVLPGHKNFLSLLSEGDIVVRSASGKEETISIDRGVMHVSNDQVRIFLDV